MALNQHLQREFLSIKSTKSRNPIPAVYQTNWCVAEHGKVELTVRVRLDVFGDEKLCVPEEPLYAEDAIESIQEETQAGKDQPGQQEKISNKWIVAKIVKWTQMPNREEDQYQKMI